MAEHLARIIGTEEDRVNCPFYWKIGACRHGDQCSRSHFKPSISQTLVLRHMYRNPPVALAIAEGQDVDDEAADQAQDHFEEFYEEVFEELANYGQVEELVACDNIGDHMVGNVYVKYASEDDAAEACKHLQGRFYGGRRIECEFSPVTDFREARCRQFVDGCCTRGGYCNFMHMKHVPRSLKRKMIRRMFKQHPNYKETAGMLADDPSRGRPPPERGYRYPRRSRSPRGGYHHHHHRRNNRQPSHSPRSRDYYRNSKRTASEERRAQIASWNDEAGV